MRSLLAAAVLLLAGTAARASTFTIALTTAGPANTLAVVTSTPSGIVCPGTCSASFTAGSTVTLGAVWPSTMAFAGWAGLPGCRNNSAICTVNGLAANQTGVATFDPTLTLQVFGSGIGVVSSSGTLINCGSTGPACAFGSSALYVFPTSAPLVLQASTGTASVFTGWTGDGGCATASTCTITLNGSEVIVATFTASAPSYPLSVSIPNAGGAVTSSPAGISCPGVCSSTFTALSSVTFTTSAAAGYRFAGWANGGCAGAHPCVVTSTSPLQGFPGPFAPAAYFYPQPIRRPLQ
jgi:Divergent InlB B-repeat domain